jgi:hypothetical protein
VSLQEVDCGLQRLFVGHSAKGYHLQGESVGYNFFWMNNVGNQNMSPQEIDALRKEVKHKMVDLGLDNRKAGIQNRLAVDLTARTGKTISMQTVNMALTGFRSTAAYQTLLQELHAMLSERINLPV